MVKLRLRGLVGTIKDKASQGRAAMTRPEALALLRATTHDPRAPPRPKHIAAVLAAGRSSRAAASAAIEALMERLARTRDACVALKCLMAAHHVAASGGFILRDQLAVVPAAGGRNYLNVSNFRDGSSHVSWELSTWVRWYGQYLEWLVSVSRALGYFLGDNDKDKSVSVSVSAVTNSELVRETESLVSLAEHIARQPATASASPNKLVVEIMAMVSRDSSAAMAELRLRLAEFRERLASLTFGDSVELLCALKTLQSCRHRLGFQEFGFWDLVGDLINDRSTSSLPIHKTLRNNAFSARFTDRLLTPVDSVNFGSGRLSVGAF